MTFIMHHFRKIVLAASIGAKTFEHKMVLRLMTVTAMPQLQHRLPMMNETNYYQNYKFRG